MHYRNDTSLDKLAEVGNVAQFVSFSPQPTGLHQEYCRIAGYSPNHLFDSADLAIATLLARSPDQTVNVRSYAPDSRRSREFVDGIAMACETQQTAERLTAGGLHVIVNETVDIADGGVSGVMLGEVIEFSPDDTPRHAAPRQFRVACPKRGTRGSDREEWSAAAPLGRLRPGARVGWSVRPERIQIVSGGPILG